ncbi:MULTISPECIES: amino acid ABC transporter permease [Actinomycetaceae]|jgi:amino ABC transporter, permease protein, 3-TM region, his/glu/gln/arg/opine family|uniref:amino acid ABC transporter permease n=1 Tax=Actinomycetaceae TaxID=2049 RepID=UPI0003975C18|nr:amino acid ABC transporter permease [Actinobaculum sp. oral taxon 183]ERH20108.1 ABC transporter, permease protein [Actinobaculum sp. oral taxon 183 str. F0552]
MDPQVIGRYLPVYGRAVLVTVEVSALGILLAIAIGLLCASVRYARVPAVGRLAGGYVQLARNTPLIVLLFFIYYGLPKVEIRLSQLASAVIGLAFIGGGYMAEAFRSGLESVDRIQWESAVSLGMRPGAAMRHVVVPQAVSACFPALVANVIFLIKETSVVSVVALADLVFVAKELIGNEYNTSEALFLLVFFYLLVVLPVSLLGSRLERRIRHAEFGH